MPTMGEMKNRMAVEGALALVTGAGSGIGKATALALANRGASVLAVDIDGTAAKSTAVECDGQAFEVDVADRDAMEDLALAVRTEFGALDILVNNAGVAMTGPFLETSLADWSWILGVNLQGVIHGCHAFGPDMVRAGQGHVVNVACALAYFPRASEPAYVTSKAAVLALSRCLRAEWGAVGVGVSAVCPGVISTPILEGARFKGERAHPEAMWGLHDTFARRGHPASKVADAIVSAVQRDRSVVPVGIEAWIGWMVRGILPAPVADRVAAATPIGT